MLLFLLFAALAWAQPCHPNLPADAKCEIGISEVRPMQFNVGMEEIEIKRQEFRAKSAEQRLALLAEKPLEIMIGPGGKYYLVDGHHHAFSLVMEDITKFPVHIVANHSKLSQKEFVDLVSKLARLRDERGRLRKFSELPRYIYDITDDPYRSLAWMVRRSGAIKNTHAPFAEFVWADFFRNKIKIDPNNWEAAVTEGIRMAVEVEEAGLPGRQTIAPEARKKFQADCLAAYRKIAKH